MYILLCNVCFLLCMYVYYYMYLCILLHTIRYNVCYILYILYIGMGLPPILGFILLRGVLSYAVLLHSTTRLNDELSIRVCEEAHEVIKATKMVGIHSTILVWYYDLAYTIGVCVYIVTRYIEQLKFFHHTLCNTLYYSHYCHTPILTILFYTILYSYYKTHTYIHRSTRQSRRSTPSSSWPQPRSAWIILEGTLLSWTRTGRDWSIRWSSGTLIYVYVYDNNINRVCILMYIGSAWVAWECSCPRWVGTRIIIVMYWYI